MKADDYFREIERTFYDDYAARVVKPKRKRAPLLLAGGCLLYRLDAYRKVRKHAPAGKSGG